MPRDLGGWTALDIGCNAGFYSLELARRGARVDAIDHDEHYLRQARWAIRRFGLEDRIALERTDVYEIGRTDRTFDLVSFLGVFCHLRYPLLALDLLARMTQRLLMFQTLMMPGDDVLETPPDLDMSESERLREPGWPKVVPRAPLSGRPDELMGAGPRPVEAMLRSSGMRVLERSEQNVYACEPARDEPAYTRERRERELFAALGR